jgi:hypothetical protein
MADEKITLKARCLCKAHTFTAQVPKSTLPLSAAACHCNSCRHVSGALYTLDAYWPEPAKNVDISGLSVYMFSKKISIHFCGTCSTPMFFGHPEDPDAALGVMTGTLENEPGDVVKILRHIFVGDTVDGGSTVWLRKPNADGTEAKRYKERDGEGVEALPFDWPPSSSLTGYEKKLEDAVPIRCKCKGVDLVLHRGNYEGKTKKELPWFIDEKTHKPIADLCVCDSCRLFAGSDLFAWTFADMSNVSFPDTKAAEGKAFPKDTAGLRALVDAKDPAVGTLKYYASSPGVQRYFCGTCSASIFYAADDRSYMVDVAMGALEASDGARAEGFVAWKYGKLDFTEDVKGGWREGLVNRVRKESTQYREDRGYPKIF